MEENKRGRGRPRLDTHITDSYGESRRQIVNAMYMIEARDLISVAAAEIPDNELLWCEDAKKQSVKSKDGVLEQIGRMILQDGFELEDCIYISNCSIEALKNGSTSREVEKAIRKIRMTWNKYRKNPGSTDLRDAAHLAINELWLLVE